MATVILWLWCILNQRPQPGMKKHRRQVSITVRHSFPSYPACISLYNMIYHTPHMCRYQFYTYIYVCHLCARAMLISSLNFSRCSQSIRRNTLNITLVVVPVLPAVVLIYLLQFRHEPIGNLSNRVSRQYRERWNGSGGQNTT